LTELDPLGADVGAASPYGEGLDTAVPLVYEGSHWATQAGNPGDPQRGCNLNGMEIPCSIFDRMAREGVLGLRNTEGLFDTPLFAGPGGLMVWVEDGEDKVIDGSNEIATNGRPGEVNQTIAAAPGRYEFVPIGADRATNRQAPVGPVVDPTELGEPPRMPLPIRLRRMAEQYREDFERAYRAAFDRLGRRSCADFFGGRDAAGRVLGATEYRVLALGRPRVNPQTGDVSVVGAQTNGADSVFVNSQGPFFNNQMVVPGRSGVQALDFGSGLRGADFGALLLLHELGHQVGLFGRDAHDPDLNQRYTRAVLNACF
jgi:hypothetical protein